MGLSSSQARLLTLTSRMHDIEYKAAKLEAQKLQMANESRKAYDDYLVALDATKIQMKTINTDGSLNYVDATYNNLTAAGYILELEGLQGRAISDSDYAKIVEFYNIAGSNRDYFIALYTNRVTPTNNQAPDGVYEIYTTDQLKALTNNNSYRLMCDISLDSTFNDLSNITIDGNGHTINVTSNNSLFNSLSNSNISNLRVVNNNNKSVGILAQTINNNSNITNVSVSGTIYNPTASFVGGFAQSIASGSKIYNCESDVNITALSHAGGFTYGISGNSEVKNCISNGSVNATKYAGGFISAIVNATVRNTVSNTDVTINHNVDESLDSGGFTASCGSGAVFENCTSNGNMTNTSNITLAAGVPNTHTIGGFVGATCDGNIKFTNCDSNSKVTSNQDYIAGFISCINPDGNIEITNCHANNSLTTGGTQDGAPAIGGFINNASSGSSTITLTDCSSAYSGDFIKVTGDTINETGTQTGVTKSCNNTAEGARLNNEKTLNSSEEVAAGILYDEYIAGHLYKESEADKYCLSTHKDDTQWLTNMVNSGFLFIFKNDKKGEKYQISVAVDTGLQEVSDEKDLRKAEAKYEADMKKIDMKDRRYDTQLAALDNERNAIKSEMETLKTVAKDNVERTFKLFS